MTRINRRAHALIDYLSGVILLLSPWIFTFSEQLPARWIAVASGMLILLMSFTTRYEPAFIKIISVEAHLVIDMVLGLFFALSPWIFGFYENSFAFHLYFGTFIFLIALFTERKSVTH